MLPSGHRVGDYEVVSLLGDGGMASVYLVRHVLLGSEHALKVLHPDLLVLPEIRERFLAEGRIQARLIHHNIVNVTATVSEPEVAGLVMEYLDGPTLGEHLARSPGPRPPSEIVGILAGLLEGVQAAHSAGITHRDIKPDNIKLQTTPAQQWRPVLLDFGVAHLSSAGESSTGHIRRLRTQQGKRMGTLGYMSPEQLQGSPQIGPTTDVFSLGCILFEMLSGQPAFSNADLQAIASRAPVAAQPTLEGLDVDPGLAAVCQRAMQEAPENRYADATEMLAGLQAAHAPPPPRSESVPQTPRRWGRMLALGGVLALLALIGLLVGLGANVQQQRHQRADQVVDGALEQLAYTRTSAEARNDPARILDAIDRAELALKIERTPASIGALALARVWAQEWDQNPNTEQVHTQLPMIDALSREAAEEGDGTGLLARALVASAACAGLESTDPARPALCNEANVRFTEASAALKGDPRAWLRVEVAWSAAVHHNRSAAGWWRVEDVAAARDAWHKVSNICLSARTDLSASPLQDGPLARECMAAAGGGGRYHEYFLWARWLRDHDETTSGLSSESIAQIYRSAHPDCRNMPARDATPWQPATRNQRQRFCQQTALLALGCPTEAAQIRARYLRGQSDPLLQSVMDADQPDHRRCYLE